MKGIILTNKFIFGRFYKASDQLKTVGHEEFFFLSLLIFSIFDANAQYQYDSLKVQHGYLHYYTKGKGKPLVLMQGNTGSSSYYLRSLADSIQDYKVILVDYQGVGKSNYRSPDTSWTKIDSIVKDYDRVRNHLKIDKWTLVGHSYGGQHALFYAAKYPEHTQKVITVAGVTTDNQMLKYWNDNLYAYQSDEDRMEMKKTMADTLLSSDEQMRKMLVLYARPAFYNKENAEVMGSFYPYDELLISVNPEYQQKWLSHPNFFKLDFSKEVYVLDIPIRIIQGRQDPVGERIAVELNMRAKNSKLTFIERCGHFPWFDQPVEFFKIFNTFLKE